MKHGPMFICAVLAVAGTFLAGSAVSADKKDKQAAMDPKMEEMMKKCEEAGTPGAAHKALEALVGNWQTEAKCWMPGSDTPNVSKGNEKSDWILGGRYVQGEFKGEFMGKPFHGIGTTGYDNVKQKYTSVWVDDMSTAMFVSEGTADSSGKVFTFEGSASCPMTGEKEKAMKHIIRIISKDKHIFEMHDPSLGEKSKTMEIVYTRK